MATAVKVREQTKGAVRAGINLDRIAAQSVLDRIMRFNANPRTRGAAAAQLNRAAQAVVFEARQIANHELRHDSRRPAGGPSYSDSFFFDKATQDSIGRFRVTYGNDGEAATWIEHGTNPHKIPLAEGTARGYHPQTGETGFLVFPFRPDSTRSRVGGPPGDWPTGGTKVFSKQVDHPGAPAFRIVERAVERVRRRGPR